MAKRNQVTAKLKIATEAQLENSKQFSRQLNNILDNFDFGEKINRQFKDAQEQLKLYNKVLEKNKDKRLISNEDLKNLEKASEGIVNIISKTENLYNNLNSQGIQKFSKEYIAKVRAQEAEIAKIKQEFQNKTGKVYDEEIKNVDKLNEKIQNLNHLKQELGKFDLEFFKEEEITRLTNQFNKAQENLKSIQSTILAAQDAYESIIKKSIDETGYARSDYNRKTNPGTLEEFTQKQEVKAQESLNNSIEKTKQKLEEIKEEKEKILSKDEESLKAIWKYNKQIQKLEQELTSNKLKLEKSLNGEELLVNIKKVTNEYNKQYQIYKTMLDASKARDEVAFQAGYGTYSNLSRKEKKAITETSSIQSQLDDDNNITNIAQTKMQEINGTIEQTNAELENSNNFLKIISEATKKLATQSERMADEQDVVQSSKNINANTNADGRETRKTTNEQTKILSRDILRSRAEGAKKGIINITDMPLNLENFSDLLDITKDTEVDDYKLAAEAINNFAIEIETTISYLKSLQNKYDSIEDFTPEEVLEIGKSNQDALINIIKNINSIFDIAENNLTQRRNTPGNSKEEQSILGRDLDYLEIRKAEILTPLNQELERIKENIKIIIDSMNDVKEPINNSEQSFQRLGNISGEIADSIKEAAEESEFLGSVWDDLNNKVGYFLSANYIFDLMIRKIQEANQAVVQMDKDMTQIGLVLGKTSGQIWKNFDTYSQMATRLNTTTSEITTAMKLFYQQGLNTSEVNKMVEASAIAAALGESTLAEASETLTSIINSYNLTAKEAIAVTDKISQVAIVSAADFNEISIAIEKVASSAASAGLDLDHMMGYLSKMIETTREAPTNIGTALKTIIANFAQFREDPSSLTEDGASMNDVDKALKTVGISLLDTSGEMRDLGKVIDELGKKWDSLSRNQKSYLATMIAGTRQQSRFYALMNDYGRTLELVAASSDSSGKSQQQFALYSNSLEAAASRLNNQWQIFFNEMTKGNGVVAGIVNLLTGLLKIVNKIGPLGSALGLISLVKSGREAVVTFNKLNKLIATRQSRTAARDSAIEDIKNAGLDSKTKQNKINKLNTDYLTLNEKDLANLTKAEKQYILSMEKINAEHARFNQGAGEMSVTLQKITEIVNGFKNKTKGIYDNLIFTSMAVKNNKMVKSITSFIQVIKEKFEKIDFSSLKDKFSAFADDAREKAKKISSAITEDLPFYLGKAKDKFKDFSVNAEFAFYKIKDASKMIGQELEFSFYHAKEALQNFVNKMPFVWGNVKDKGKEIVDSFGKAFYELDNKLTRLKQNLPFIWYDLKLLGKKVAREFENVIYSLKINFKKLRNEAPLIWFNMRNIGKKVAREFDDLFRLIRKGFKSIKNEAPYVWYKLKKTSKNVFSDLNKNFKKLTENLKTFPKGFISGLNALKKTSKKIFGKIDKEANKVGKNKQQQFISQQNMNLPIDSNNLSIISKITEKFKNLANILRDKVFNSSIAKNIEMNQFIKDVEASRTFKERFTEAIDSLKAKMLELKQSGATIFSTLATGFKVKIKETGTNIKATFIKLKTNAQKLVSDFGANFKNKIKQIPATFKTAWTKIKTEGLKATNGFLINFETGIKKAITNLALGVQLIKVMALELTKTLAITALISTLTQLVSGIGKGIKSALGIDTESYIENAEKAQENAENINSLTSEYEELAKKINKTEEEQERLKEITEEVTKIDAELGRQLKENAENYNANIRAMKEYAKLQEKIAAQENARAIKSEASVLNNLDAITDENLWISWFGSKQDKELLRDEQFNIWKNLASSRGKEFELNEAQTSMLDKYVNSVIKANQGFGYMTVKANTGEFDDMVIDFINSLQMLTTAQQEQYLQTISNMNNSSTTITELYNQIANLDIPNQVKYQLWNQVSSIQTGIQSQINDNGFIINKDLALENVEKLAIDKAENLFNPDLTNLNEKEQKEYSRDISTLLTDKNISEEFIKLYSIGGEDFENYINKLKNIGKISDSTAEALVGLKNAAAELEKLLTSLDNLKNILDENIRMGGFTQLDILEKIINKEFSLSDVNINTLGTTDGIYNQALLSINTKGIIENAKKEINTILAPLANQKTILKDQIGAHEAQLQNEATKAAQDYINQKAIVDSVKQQLSDAETVLAKKGGASLKRENAYSSLFTIPFGLGMDLVNTIRGVDVEGEWEAAKTAESDLQTQLANEEQALSEAEEAMNNSAKALKNLKDETTEAGKAFKEENEWLKKQHDIATDTYNAMEKLLTFNIQPLEDFTAVFDQFQIGGLVNQELETLQNAWNLTKEQVQDYRVVAQMVAKDPALINCLNLESETLEFSTEKLYEHARGWLKTELTIVDQKIRGTKAIIALLDDEINASDDWKNATNEDIASAIAYQQSEEETSSDTTETEITNLQNSSDTYAAWGNAVQAAYQAVEKARSLYIKGLNSESETNYLETVEDLKGINLTPTVEDVALDNVDKSKIDELKKLILGDSIDNSEDVEKLKEKYAENLTYLEQYRAGLQKDYDNIEGYFSRNASGSTDAFKQVIDKLEHFYNYLRKIEEIEAKLSKLETKQSYAALSNSYNIDLIKQENDLLTEKIKLYSKYIAEEEDYLKKRREEITSQYSDWAYFTESGLLQLKQVNFVSNTEEEKARYDAFKELIDLYTSEYNTALENSNSMLDAHSQKLQNIQEMWDKQNQSIQDVLDNLEYLKKVVTDKKNLQFSPTEGFMYNEKIFKATLKQYEQLKKNREDLLNESDASYENIMSSSVRDLLQYNEAKGYFELTAYAETLLDIVGLEGDRARLAQELVAKDQKMAETRQQNYEDISSINSEIKDLIENQLSEGESILQSWTDQIDKMFDMIDKNINKLETKQNLFGITTDTIQEQFDAISKAAAIANNEYQNLQKIGDSLAKQIKDSYGNYVDEIDGQFFINEAAINNDTTLTELQRIEAKTLVGKYNIIQEQTDKAEDLYYGYLEKLQEMEEEKQDATISLIQEIHDELMEIDQEEVDALRDKYSEMSNLDNEYYSALQQKISDARQNRQIEQEGYNIAELQNRLAITTKDTSTAYSADARSLRKELQDALQNRADSEIDREMERIQREQQERQKDRDLQIQQMENLITFKDENGIYWKESQALFEQGRVKTEAFLASRYEKEDISQAELQNKLDNANDELDRAYALLDGTIYSALQQEIENISITNRIITDLSENTEEGYANLTAQLNQVVEALTSKDSVILQELSKWFSQNYDDESDSIGVTTGDTRNQTIEGLKSQMEANSQAWWKANEAGDTQKMKDLADRNNEIARVLEEKYGIILRRRADGSWYYVGTGDKYYTASRYADGGYVNYTGIAQVDGTPTKPEAFLNAKQTALFENLRNALSSYNSKSSVKTSDNSSSSVSIDNLTISVKEVADVDSIDKITKEVKRSIYNDSTKGSTIKVTRR